jgi:hypothetical protein
MVGPPVFLLCAGCLLFGTMSKDYHVISHHHLINQPPES